jgi:hypothetical protein
MSNGCAVQEFSEIRAHGEISCRRHIHGRGRIDAKPDGVLASGLSLMATCPRCLGALTENHRCPRGRFSRLSDALVTLAAGGLVGALLVFLAEDRPSTALLLASAALGAILARAVRDALSPRL